ncbi:ATP-binding protein [Streptomyces sp. SPB074]|uniref:ATP-binding protein n=1 Tax=Streptomyces sp. (strain SPB074) TaxID=465543 RepID=UPI00056837AF|nr:ATP-binding protein [Streptomyces sp. SPB074]
MTALCSGGPAAPRTQWTGEFAPVLTSVPEARQTVRRVLPRLGARCEELVPLAVTELMANAVVHGGGARPLLLLVSIETDRSVHIGVTDNSARVPGRCAMPDAEVEAGRGLALLRLLGVRLSWDVDGDGRKRTHALVPPASAVRERRL